MFTAKGSMHFVCGMFAVRLRNVSWLGEGVHYRHHPTGKNQPNTQPRGMWVWDDGIATVSRLPAMSQPSNFPLHPTKDVHCECSATQRMFRSHTVSDGDWKRRSKECLKNAFLALPWSCCSWLISVFSRLSLLGSPINYDPFYQFDS